MSHYRYTENLSPGLSAPKCCVLSQTFFNFRVIKIFLKRESWTLEILKSASLGEGGAWEPAF